jgi:rod shape-determining protein MreC
MAARITARGNAILLAALLTGNLVLMSGSTKDAAGATRLEAFLSAVGAPFVASAESAGGVIHTALRSSSEILVTRSVNRQLLSDVRRLSDEAVRLREAEKENHRLRRLLGMREGLVPRSVAATVVTARLDDQNRMFVVDRGADLGVTADLAVVAWGGAVGRVTVASSGYAKVRLLTDVNSGVASIVQRSRVQGIVVGRGDAGLDLLYVPRFSDVAHGDRVVTSGLDGIFPRGFGVGRVRAVSESPDGSQTIHLEPELDYRLVEEVLIVLERPSVEGDAS